VSLPQSPVDRDLGELPARGYTITESAEAWRRIEEQLRGFSRRLDSSERSHGESNRFLSRTAQEMNVNAREQGLAFEQLGQNVRTLRERLERLERSATTDNIREAIKALHQGLSRLADQLTTTAGQSASQLAQVTANLEQLASHVGKVWEDADNAAQLLDRRIDLAQAELTQRLETSEQALDVRLSATEKTVQFNTNALDHALEKIETAVQDRATLLADSQRRAIQHEESVRELKGSLVELEARLPGASLEARLRSIETSVGGLRDRIDETDPTQIFAIQVQTLSQRLEQLESEHAGLVEELRTRTAEPQPEIAAEPSLAEQFVAEPPAGESGISESFVSESFTIGSFTSEPPQTIADEPAIEHFAAEAYAVEPPAHEAAPAEEPAVHFQQEPEFPSPAFLTEETAYAATARDLPPGHLDLPLREMPQETSEAEPYADFDGAFADPDPDHFLTQARFSALAAAEKAENERMIRLSAFQSDSFYTDHRAADREEKRKRRYLIPSLAAGLVVMVVATALMLSRHAGMPQPLFAATKPSASAEPVLQVAPAHTGVETGVQASAIPLPQALTDKLAAAAQDNSSDDVSSITPAKPDLSPAPPQIINPAAVRPAAAPVKTATAQNAPTVSGDRVTQLANAGNPVALAILGLKALDGTTANLPDAVRFLTEAAEKGQAVAQYRLGTLYERGQGVTADSAKAMHWYQLAATQGNRKAMHNLAVAYASGPSAKRNMTEAARWFAKAAGLGLSDSQFNLAVLYERGEGVQQSLTDAYKWYAIAAASGDAEAKARMSVLETQLDAADKTAASKSANNFHAAPLNRSTNVPPETADLGG
jgi:localization factor PodJL